MDRLDHRWSGLFFCLFFSIANKNKKVSDFWCNRMNLKMFFLHIIIGTVFIVPKIDREGITGRK